MPVVDIVLVSVIGLTLAGVAWVLLRVEQRSRAQRRHDNELADRDRRVAAVYAAAVEGDTGLGRVLDGGADVDAQDRRGDTALHRAFYEGAVAAIERLLRHGADARLPNQDGLVPDEMTVVALIADELEQTLPYIAVDGSWADPERGLVMFESLRRVSPRLFNPALVRAAARSTKRRRLLSFAIKLGVAGSEERLAAVLDAYGTVKMATICLNCGSPVLYEAARNWAWRNGYQIVHQGNRPAVTWGTF